MIDEYSKSYWEELDLPLRGAMSARVDLHVRYFGENEYKDYPVKNIIKISQKKYADPISRRFPRNNITITVSDFSREIYNILEKDLWYCFISLSYKQEHSGENSFWSPEDNACYYFAKATHSANNTVITGVSSLETEKFRQLKKYNTTTVSSRSKKETLSEILNLDRDIWKGDPYFDPDFFKFKGIDGVSKYGAGVFPECSRRDAVQLFANSLGASVFSKSTWEFPNDYTPRLMDNDYIIIQKFDKTPPAEDWYTLKIENVMKDSIKHEVSPSRVGVNFETRGFPFNTSSMEKTLVEIKSDDFIMTDIPGGQQPGELITREYRYPASSVTSFNTSGFYKAEARPEVAIVTLETPITSGKTWAVVGETLDLVQQIYTDPASLRAFSNAETVRNPAMSMGGGVAPIREYYKLRHTLKMRYRGDAAIEPGDKIWFQYAWNKKVPCIVIENNSEYTGTLSGNITLKILLTDEEIAAL